MLKKFKHFNLQIYLQLFIMPYEPNFLLDMYLLTHSLNIYLILEIMYRDHFRKKSINTPCI